MGNIARTWSLLTVRQSIGALAVSTVVLGVVVVGFRALLYSGFGWLGGALAVLAASSLLAGVVIYGFGAEGSRRAGKIAIAGGVFVYLVLGLELNRSGWGYWVLWIPAVLTINVIIGLMLEAREISKSTKEARPATLTQR